MSTFGFFPFGGDAFAGTGTGDVATLVDGAVLSGAAVGTISPNIIERVTVAGSLDSSSLAAQVAAAEAFGIDDAVGVAWLKLLTDSAALGGTAAAARILLGELTDTLVASGLAENRLDAIAAIAEAMVIEDLAQRGFTESALSEGAASDVIADQARIIAAALSEAAAADLAAPSLRMVAIAAEETDLADLASNSAHLFAAVADGMTLFATITLGGVEYSCWVLSLNRTEEGTIPAVVEYQNFPFNSFCEFNGSYYGASETGIYRLGGDDDDGDPIDAWVRSALSTLGTGKQKRMPSMYLGYTSDGTLVLKVVTTSAAGEKEEDWYVATQRTASATRENRIKLGRGLKSVYWAFQLQNKAGADFSIDVVEFLPLVLDGRL